MSQMRYSSKIRCGVVETTAFVGQKLPRSWARSAHLLAALEEDHTGRQPVHFTPSQDSGPVRQPELDDNLAHVFLEDSLRTGGPIGYARVDLVSRTAELTMLPVAVEQVASLAASVREEFGVTRFWAKGQDSAAAALDALAIRSLRIMSRCDLEPEPTLPSKSRTRIRPFDPVTDTDSWLGINSRIFAALPDQANMTRAGLGELLEATWHDPAGFLVAEMAGEFEPEMVGFHWTKVDLANRFHHRISGEVFVLGVLPEHQGTGVAASLLNSGLRRISSLGITNVHLYVEGDNLQAQSFYESHGFSAVDHDQLLRLKD